VIEKCDEKRVREIIKDELGKVENNEDTIDGDTQNIRSKTVKKEAVTIVIDEMNERKSRENNLIITLLRVTSNGLSRFSLLNFPNLPVFFIDVVSS
jgi:hypothetical protein